MGSTVPKNNFEFLRLIFAIFVLVSHSYEISGQSYFDFLDAHTNFQIGFSYIGVRGFFIISGYLIFQSLMRSRDVIDYFWKRALRIFPGLLVVLVLTVLLGPFVYDGIPGPYWQNPDVWWYIPRNAMLYPLQPRISGIFDHNVYPSIINGSLWTICYEFTCYIGLAILFMVRKRLPAAVQWILLSVFIVSSIGTIFYYLELREHWFFINMGDLFEFIAYFLGGSLLAFFKYERFKYIDLATVVSIVVIVASVLLGFFRMGFHLVFLPFVVIGLGIKRTPYLRDIGDKIGDISYGIYIYGFLVQQTLMHFYRFDYIALFFVTVPISMVLGYLSWHLVEKRALKLKNWQPTDWIERMLGNRKPS